MASFFLTRALAAEAVELVLPSVEVLMRTRTGGRTDLHIVILDPTVTHGEGVRFLDAILYEYPIGDRGEWKHNYEAFAHSKAEQAWRTGQPNLWVQMFAPALLQRGDTRYWSSFVYNGLVVACSGIQPWFDFMVAGWIAVACQQLAQDKKQHCDDNMEGDHYK